MTQNEIDIAVIGAAVGFGVVYGLLSLQNNGRVSSSLKGRSARTPEQSGKQWSDVLGVEPNADIETIDAAYKQKLREIESAYFELSKLAALHRS
jgi:hypothetical protein